ncbi:hypothetical protein Patl1_31726 [Pistacia atlantica]|uniref:Uncharacterized protein n=1 Tax=Pistacia atlantica TaxID=434234 RepID=A0ACC1ARB1_9ROSI|nr:hypothetical protein Patl1_31726 [Pistacia atlantica]
MKNLQENKEIDVLPDLPEEIIFEILKRVPAKYLHENFRYVCKGWNNLISSNMFMAQNTPQNKSGVLISVPTTDIKWSSKVVQYQTKLLEMDDKVLGFKRGVSCDELTHQVCLTLPKCHSGCLHKACGAALGFDPCKQEYKVVHMYADGYGFEIFTLGCSDNAWKRVPGPFKDEKSIRMYLPDSAGKTNERRYNLLEMGGNLALVYTVSDTQFDVWILEDFGGQEWTKRHSIMAESTNYTNFKSSSTYKTLPNFMFLVAVAAMRDGEVLMFKYQKDEGKVADCSYLYDMKQRQLKKFRMKIRSGGKFIPHRGSLYLLG